jgi:hypothetical protein
MVGGVFCQGKQPLESRRDDFQGQTDFPRYFLLCLKKKPFFVPHSIVFAV